nr:hypothetical protein [Methanocaldococcus vulcanius]
MEICIKISTDRDGNILFSSSTTLTSSSTLKSARIVMETYDNYPINALLKILKSARVVMETFVRGK